MSQPATILAFRKRLKSYGYFDIHIKRSDDKWIVSAREPLGGNLIVVAGYGFNNYFRRKRGGGFVYLPAGKPSED